MIEGQEYSPTQCTFLETKQPPLRDKLNCNRTNDKQQTDDETFSPPKPKQKDKCPSKVSLSATSVLKGGEATS
jgi:hypothetical protein